MKNILLVHSSPRGSESYSQRVTGNQGGAVAETLQGSGFRLRGPDPRAGERAGGGAGAQRHRRGQG